MELEKEPSAWLVPRLLDFTHAKKVSFTRQEGCTKSDQELKSFF
jgi:hypothetical protein